MPRTGALRHAMSGVGRVSVIFPHASGVVFAVLLVAAGCGDGGGDGATPATPPGPAPTPAPQTSATISFREITTPVPEGAAAEVGIRYRTSNLSAPITLQVEASGGTASEDDYVLSAASLEIPAGSGTTGELTLELNAVEDTSFAEGDETLILSVQPPAGSNVRVDGSLEVVISDAGVTPCPGIRVSGEPPVLADDWDVPTVETESATIRLTLEMEAAAAGVVFDWVGPYRDYHHYEFGNVDPVTALDQNLVHWSFAATAEGVRHTFEIEWLAHLEAGFRFRSEGGGCVGEPEAVCTGAGCELRP